MQVSDYGMCCMEVHPWVELQGGKCSLSVPVETRTFVEGECIPEHYTIVGLDEAYYLNCSTMPSSRLVTTIHQHMEHSGRGCQPKPVQMLL